VQASVVLGANVTLVVGDLQLRADFPARPLAMYKNWMNSTDVPRSKPSAMFDMMETDARRI
jgi:hypothetical protein